MTMSGPDSYDGGSTEPRVRLRMTESQHATLYAHLFPGDGNEAVAMLLCGRAGGANDEILIAHLLELIPHAECVERTPSRVVWPTDRLPALLARVAKDGLGLVKVHSHPGGWSKFSAWDDAADRELFPGVSAWSPTERPHLSVIMTPDGDVSARSVTADGQFLPVDSVSSIGDTIRELQKSSIAARTDTPQFAHRTSQAFGAATTERLGRLRIGVVGCSGTGSWVVEMLARLGVGQLVLVDPDHVEEVNLNRIVHATLDDAKTARAKVDVLADAVRAMGTGVNVAAHPEDVVSPKMIRLLSTCDAIMGCVDSVDARDVLGRLSLYYTLPYVDVGVRLVADGSGGIAHIVGSAQYVHPEAPTLFDRGLYTAKQLADAGLKRSDPRAYTEQLKARYITNATEVRPAVASVNAFYASLAVNELLARLHSFREDNHILGVTISLSQLRIVEPTAEPVAKATLTRVGRGDTAPLLGLPLLSEPT